MRTRACRSLFFNPWTPLDVLENSRQISSEDLIERALLQQGFLACTWYSVWCQLQNSRTWWARLFSYLSLKAPSAISYPWATALKLHNHNNTSEQWDQILYWPILHHGIFASSHTKSFVVSGKGRCLWDSWLEGWRPHGGQECSHVSHPAWQWRGPLLCSLWWTQGQAGLTICCW